ncbi:MAG TPA: carbamoyltransferase HypF [Acidobacteriota bacterium]|nr:carbamoyltransferase HypF [Acidobacteriota bacterium]
MADQPDTQAGGKTQRLRITLRGAVQGVGFRPFVYRLATDLRLMGWVNNSPRGVTIEVEGDGPRLREFLDRLEREKPPRASIQSLEHSYFDPVRYVGFEIRPSENDGARTALILPDIATCSDCIDDVLDPANRRYMYPFTNCTNCGPRFSIIEALPYDRPRTTMRHFAMCPECRAEYDDPRDRRFHAQPNACPTCGPHLQLWNGTGVVGATHHEALLAAAAAVTRGKIVAVKGLGGFHLIVDACNRDAVVRLRKRKAREEKPFALMFPSLTAVRAECDVQPLEERLLLAPEAPIVLLRRRADGDARVVVEVAPGNPWLGVMLPYTPLHHILMSTLQCPVVATSGNLSDEPICIDEREALTRLLDVADLFLVHNRPIHRHIDDSIVRVIMEREQVLRRARGYAPLPIPLSTEVPPSLAVGAHLKNAIATGMGREVFVSQHIGDLESAEAVRALQDAVATFPRIHDLHPQVVACDLHPDYASTRLAEKSGLPLVRVQHHYAHILACMAENELEAPIVGIAWDGTGFGTDGTVWGGEFLHVSDSGFTRVAHMRPFRLPGGDVAVREPRRAALGILYEFSGGDFQGMSSLPPLQQFSETEKRNIERMLKQGINSPLTSSVGRLFDAVASLLDIRHVSHFEGQAAMELEFAVWGHDVGRLYRFEPPAAAAEDMTLDWSPMLQDILTDRERGISTGEIAAVFHNTLVEMAVSVVRHRGDDRVALSGGCFQNRYLTERMIVRLRDEGIRVYWHQRIPPNDGGIALGQIVAAGRRHEGA